ncbi:hypothetical protein HBZS_112800 [Helicobacter bizzozeronii CCUG 35545]|nr:hypothetical protein HBZS_112800 [Helicobacter bizzozeronii CCUG 35545]
MEGVFYFDFWHCWGGIDLLCWFIMKSREFFSPQPTALVLGFLRA